ncbi:MAG: TrbG/VirB9 family P-type conjugative transfer protein [Pseudomonadota bacterium]|nr:TrbG/VirB9 family P-type conjugative transfer protein [Pseudomonadota bacterium]
MRLADAETIPKQGLVDQRIRTAVYSTDEVYRLYGFIGFHLDLEFEGDESFTSLSGGDLGALTYSAHDNVLTLKPKVASAEMNLAVSTNKRRYYFEYSVSAQPPRRFPDQVMYAVRFSYPAPQASPDGSTPEERVRLELARASQNRPRNVDYWFCGNPEVKPVAASDDGVHTRLTFGAKDELPAVFVRNDDDSESLLNFNVEDGDVIIHRVARRFIVRRGKLEGCIVNKGFVGSGERLESGTVAPDVQRERKDPRP